MKVRYHENKLDFPSRNPNVPVELPASLDAVKEALASLVGRQAAARA